ncbi:MAG TPA: hypothetical protein VGG33_11735 [Polyangia bacterium]
MNALARSSLSPTADGFATDVSAWDQAIAFAELPAAATDPFDGFATRSATTGPAFSPIVDALELPPPGIAGAAHGDWAEEFDGIENTVASRILLAADGQPAPVTDLLFLVTDLVVSSSSPWHEGDAWNGVSSAPEAEFADAADGDDRFEDHDWARLSFAASGFGDVFALQGSGPTSSALLLETEGDGVSEAAFVAGDGAAWSA